mgnify:CR=1 FL=1
MFELFNGIIEADKIRILREIDGNTLLYKKGNRILSSFKNDDIVCIVLSGHIQIIKNDFNGNTILIEELYKDDIFGSISANISSDEYEIITKDDSEIIVIEFDHIINNNSNLDSYNRFLKNLLQVFYKRINEFNNRIEIITNMTIRNKLLAYFKLMTKNNNLRFFILPFNYSDLANYLAINRSAMSRELKALKEEGLIEIKGKRIKLLYYN